MKKKLLFIGILGLVLLTVLFLIFHELYQRSDERQINQLNSNTLGKNVRTTNYKLRTTNMICYKEIRNFKPDAGELNGIAVDNKSNIYITGGKGVQIYNKDLKKIASFNISSEANCINTGFSILNSQSSILIYLGIYNHIEVYDLKGKLLRKWDGYSEQGIITSIAIRGNVVYAADAGNRVILKYDKDGNLLNVIGNYLRTTNYKLQTTNYKFIIPGVFFDIAIGKDGELWAANTGKHQIVCINDESEIINSWGKASMELEGFGACCNPSQFSILPDGSFVTYEKGLNRIKIYDSTGKYECLVSQPAKIDEKAMQYCSVSAMVHDLAAGPNGDIYVLETASGLVRIFTKK